MSPRSGSTARSASSPPRTPGSTATRSACRLRRACRTRFLEARPEPMARTVGRYARTHGPFPTAQLAAPLRGRSDAGPGPARGDGTLIRGEILPGGTQREWCEADVLRRVRRASLAHLRQEVEPADRRDLRPLPPRLAGRRPFPPAGAGPDRLREILVPLQGVALTPKVWERDVLPRRRRRLQPGLARRALHQRRGRLDRGRSARPKRRSGRLLLPRGRAPGRAAAGQRQARAAGGTGPRCDPRTPGRRAELLARPGRRTRVHRRKNFTRPSGIWLSPGEITNDSFAPLRAPRLRSVQRLGAPWPAFLQPPRRRRARRSRAAGR